MPYDENIPPSITFWTSLSIRLLFLLFFPDSMVNYYRLPKCSCHFIPIYFRKSLANLHAFHVSSTNNLMGWSPPLSDSSFWSFQRKFLDHTLYIWCPINRQFCSFLSGSHSNPSTSETPLHPKYSYPSWYSRICIDLIINSFLISLCFSPSNF